MTMSNACEKSYTVDARYSNFYAGGDVAWSQDGQRIYCLNTTEVCAVDVATGQVVAAYGTNVDVSGSAAATERNAVEELEDAIYSFALSPDNAQLLTAHRSGLLRLWSLETQLVCKLWKAQHKGPIVKVQFSACGQLVCSSGADSVLRVWDYKHNSCLCALRECPGPALVVMFHPHVTRGELYAAGADNTIYCWNYAQKELVRQLRGHLSQVTALSFMDDGDGTECRFLASVGRDKVLIVWQLSDGAQYKVIPMYAELEGVCYMQLKAGKNVAPSVVVACANGSLKSVDYNNSKITNISTDDNHEIKLLMYCRSKRQLAVVTAEQNILVYNASAKTLDLECVKQLIGFNDEILDICLLGEDDRFLAVATNSKNIKVYDTIAQMNCKIVTGHKDTVMTLSSAGASNLLLSAGKDLSICLWEIDATNFTLRCIARNNSSHTATIGCISFGFNSTATFASVCQDGSLKVWCLKKAKSENYSFNLKYSAIAHEKEVNSVAFSPNNKILATASQDKTAKLWSSETHAAIGTLRGHTRGVWCVRFSPVDQIVLTSSSDCSLRIWSLANLVCLKRLEQECTILRAEFIDYGKYIISAASDGLIKIWNIKTNACVQTLDMHTDRIWSLAVSARSKKCFYSGGADSKLIKWRDDTEQCRNVEIDKRQALVLQEQQLQSLLQQRHNLEKAFRLALTLHKPKVTYEIISQYVRQRNTEPLRKIILQLEAEQRVTLLEHAKAWSTNSRHSHIANIILHFLLSDFIANPSRRTSGMGNLVEVLTPYMERHYKRANELKKELSFLDFIVKCI